MTKSRYIFVILLSILIILLVIDLAIGSVSISFTEACSGFIGKPQNISELILEQRFLSAITAVLSCAFLAICGLYLQVLFRNHLAGPSVLGISSGSLLGMSIFTFLIASFSNIDLSLKYTSLLFSWAGGMAVLMLLWSINRKTKSTQTLLIIGLLISFGASAIIDLLKIFFNARQLQFFTVWNMASFQNTTWFDIMIMVSAFALCLPMMIWCTPYLNFVDLGDDMALSMGTPLARFKQRILLITGILVGVTTALCGPIAFIGMAVPQFVKLWKKHNFYEGMSISVLLTGGIFGLITDILSKSLWMPQLIPVNTISSLLGIPIVLWIIFKHRNFD